MTNSEHRSLVFELSQKLRPRDADRFEKWRLVSKNRVISPKKQRYREHEFGGFAEPIVIRSTWTDLHQFELALTLSITIPSVCLSSERIRATDDYRHQTMSLIISCIVFALIITINISCIANRRQKAVFAIVHC